MKKITISMLALAMLFSASAQNKNFLKPGVVDKNASPSQQLVSKSKSMIGAKLEALQTKNNNRSVVDETVEHLDSIYVSEDDVINSKFYFVFNDNGLNTKMDMFMDVGSNGELVKDMSIEYSYSDKGLEENRVEYQYDYNNSSLEKSAETDYFYDETDRLDSMFMLMNVEGMDLEIGVNLVYNESNQVSSTIMFSDIFNTGDLQRVHQMDYYYTEDLLDSVYESTLSQDLVFAWDQSKLYEYNEYDQISKFEVNKNSGDYVNSEREVFTYVDGYLDEKVYSYNEGSWTDFSKEEIEYPSREDVLSPVFFAEMPVNYLDFGPTSQIQLYSHDGSDWYEDGKVDFYYSGEGTGILNNEIASDYFAMYPNPTNGELTINVSGEGNHEVQVFSMSGQLVASELVSTQQTIDLSTIESGYYFVQVSQNGVTLGAKKLIKQ